VVLPKGVYALSFVFLEQKVVLDIGDDGSENRIKVGIGTLDRNLW
jgi:hypothetical protein